ncbi:MAG: addiction module toxin RelE [Thermoplasmata archaeon HGW-Thermoplasmata-2]|nr:MAG: addiction module toxin RelE [Thermoplasmata archaeon HGW-Thermoplasmata-2]
MYGYELRKSVEKIFFKLAKKDSKLLKDAHRKIEEIRSNPNHCKNLRYPLQRLKRVHVGGSFVMVFSVDEARKIIIIEEFDHHDNIYV